MRRRIVIDPRTPIVRLGGRPPKTTLGLLIAQLGLFLIYAFADGPTWVGTQLATSGAQTVGAHKLWQPLSALWLHLGTRGLLLDLLAVWIFGSALERWWGARRLLLFFTVTGAVGLLGGALAGLAAPAVLLAGGGGASIAMMVATAVIFPRHLTHIHTLFPLRARVFALLMGAFVLVGTALARQWLDLVVQLCGGLCALPFLWSPRNALARWRVARAKKKFKVIDGRSDNGPRYLN